MSKLSIKKELPIKEIFGIPIFVGNKSQLLTALSQMIESPQDRTQVVYTPNPEQITLGFHDQSFRGYLQSADLNLPDGAGVVWALRRQMHNSNLVAQKIPGREVFHDLLVLAQQKGWRIFLLGGKKDSSRLVVTKFQNLKRNNSDSKFDMAYDEGAIDIANETLSERGRVLNKIKDFRPQLLFVAYGAPWQEKWIWENKDQLSLYGVHLAMVVGGAIDYEAGRVARVPAWIQRLNMEWSWRLLTEPWRWRRQLKGLEFFWRTIALHP